VTQRDGPVNQSEPTGDAMKIFALAAIVIAMTMTTGAYAQDKGTCKVQATTGRDRALAGAALTSFMKKCEDDAKKACDAQAAEKKLNGAAKTSFTKKCVTDAIGA
jgi:hypothetical protein